MRRVALPAVLALAACSGTPQPPPPKPGPLLAGVATVPLDAPVGLAMGGYSRSKNPGDPGSPWAEKLPGSRGVQTAPSARAIALTDGVTHVVIVRIDTCLTTSTLRWKAEAALRERGHDATLVVSATHTHAGPARYFRPAPAEGSGGLDPTTIAMDTWDNEVEERLGASIAAAAANALDALKPASVGVATVDAGTFNRDRRCENDDLYGEGFRDKTLTVVRLDEVDEAGTPVRPLTGFLHFALHGTILEGNNTLMSVDAPGALELFGSDAVGVPLLFLQGSAGDVSPTSGGLGHQGFQAIERLGRVAGLLVKDAWQRATPPTRPASATLQRFEKPLDLTREALGYARGEFAENGAIACGFGASACPPVENAPKDILCIPLKKRPFSQTTVAALRLEEVLFATLPGEPTTAIGNRVKAFGAGVDGVKHVLVAGYAQDHYGYILESPDYLRLGYEPSVSPWGWKLGDFLVARVGEAVGALGTKEPQHALPAFTAPTRRVPSNSASSPAAVGTVADLARLTTATFRFEGGDPGLGTPDVFLEREEGGGFVPVMASPLRKLSGGPDLVLRYDASPTFLEDATATHRTHRWTAEWETLPDTPAGRYRLVAKGRAKLSGAEQPYEVASNAFTLAVAGSAGAAMTATLGDDGLLSFRARFPPNPTVYDADGVVVGNYRLRDPYSTMAEGALAQGGQVAATVTLPDSSTRAVTLQWDATARAHVGAVPKQSGTYRVHVDAQGVTDSAGNTNAAALDVSFAR